MLNCKILLNSDLWRGTRSALPASQRFREEGVGVWNRCLNGLNTEDDLAPLFLDELSLAEYEYKCVLIGSYSMQEN